MNGLLIVNKEAGCTSRDIVNIVSKKLKIKKIGHTGTLDPMAEGVLVLCIGEATKIVEIITSSDKEYEAEITLGLNTDTLDITGNVLKEEEAIFTKEDILKSLVKIKGFYEQTVPIYSAVKINGKKLYQYARNNEEVILPTRTVEIKEIKLISNIKHVNNKTIFSIKCTVSKGTYIRSLAKDIAEILGTIGVMSKLNRTRQGKFLIKDSYKLEDILSDNYKIIPLSDNLFDYKVVIATDLLLKKVMNGALIENIYGEEVILIKDTNDNLLAIYKAYEKDRGYLKPWKMFKGGIL